MRRVWIQILLAVTLADSSARAQSVETAPPQVLNAAPQTAQRPPVGRQPLSNDVALKTLPAANDLHAAYQGILEGYLYWDITTVQHNPLAACDGLSVKVSVGTPAIGSTPSFTNFTYLNNRSTLVACAYAVKVPVGQDLQVQVSVTPSAFSQTVVPVTSPTANNANGTIKILGGKCNHLPPAVPSAAVLRSRWWTCGNFAYNVNFLLQSSGANLLMGAEQNPGILSSHAQGTKNPGPTGMLATGTVSGNQLQGSLGAIQGNSRTVPAVQSQGALAGIQGNGQGSLSAKSGQKALVNADVVKMVNGGLPESVVISSIQSGPTNFNFGPDGCRSLQQAHVSQNILNAMSGGNVQPCTDKAINGNGTKAADELNPQPYPPKGKTIDPALQFKLGPAKTGPLVRNPTANQRNAVIIAVLEQQRGAADLEASQMKLSLRPVQAGALGGQSQLMSDNGSASPNQPRAVARNSGATDVTEASGPIPASLGQLHNVNMTALVCTQDPTFRILSVSGSAAPATFTPIDQYNLYTITGCSFGNPGANDKVYIYGTGTFRGNFTIKFWSDNSVVVSLDESITGIPDLSNVTLVVQRNDDQQAQKQGCKFYAVRKTVPLSAIPSSWVKLANFPFGFAVEYSSPLTTGNPATTATAYARRNANGKKFDPTGQSDYYDFSQLAPGWTTDSFQVTTYPQGCPYLITYKQDFGTWDSNWDSGNPNNIRVDLSDTTCSGILPPYPWVNYQNWTGSYYSLQVWVIGPRGVDPLTNQPGT